MKSINKYRNQVFPCDVMEILRELPDGSVDMIYGDPDYGVGINYGGVKFTQRWGEYIDWYTRLTQECMRVLKEQGNLFMLNYPKQNAYLWVNCLDKLAYDVHEYVWVFNTNVGHSKRHLTTAHRSILHATKSKGNAFYKEQIAEAYKNPEDRRIKKKISEGSKGRMPYSWLEYNLVKNVSKDKTFHACQIPLELVEVLIKSCTKPKDDCFILFGGSGSELVLCRELKRNFISCEVHSGYYEMILNRLGNKNGEISSDYRISRRQQKPAAKQTPQEQLRLMEKGLKYRARAKPRAPSAAGKVAKRRVVK